MDDDTAAAIVAIGTSIADLAQAIQGLNANQQALYRNLHRLSERLAIHECTTALAQMGEERVSH